MKVYLTFDDYGVVQKVFSTADKAVAWVLLNRLDSLMLHSSLMGARLKTDQLTIESLQNMGYCDIKEVE